MSRQLEDENANLTGSTDSTAILWDAATRQQLLAYRRHETRIDALAQPRWQADARHQWAEQGDSLGHPPPQPLRSFAGHTRSIVGASFSPMAAV